MNKPQYIFSNNYYSCPVCNSKLCYIYNLFDNEDNLYTLQCPVDYNHCTRKCNLSEQDILSGGYHPISDIYRCSVCNKVLCHNQYKNILKCKNNCTNNYVKITPRECSIKGYFELD
ncbi:MAG: hypothetical protein IJE43_22225 [Alphaproteobacteria bacterium]|nr:hypothetical protein [Alphaproteobacteria bacterium]MBQ6887686.1 hypothetical protein [Lachnospiraceae bacterium]